MNKHKGTFKKLDLVTSQLLRVIQVGGSELVRDARVKSGVREIKKSRKGGQVDLERLLLGVALISEAACDAFRNDDGDDKR